MRNYLWNNIVTSKDCPSIRFSLRSVWEFWQANQKMCKKWVREDDIYPSDKMDMDPILKITHPEFIIAILQSGNNEYIAAGKYLHFMRKYYDLWHSNREISIELPQITTSPLTSLNNSTAPPVDNLTSSSSSSSPPNTFTNLLFNDVNENELLIMSHNLTSINSPNSPSVLQPNSPSPVLQPDFSPPVLQPDSSPTPLTSLTSLTPLASPTPLTSPTINFNQLTKQLNQILAFFQQLNITSGDIIHQLKESIDSLTQLNTYLQQKYKYTISITSILSTLVVENFFSQVRAKVRFPNLQEFAVIFHRALNEITKMHATDYHFPIKKPEWKKYNIQHAVSYSINDIKLINKKVHAEIVKRKRVMNAGIIYLSVIKQTITLFTCRHK